MTIRIVSLNCWGGRVFPQLLDYLRTADADIYCLQEIYHAPQGNAPRELRFAGEHSPWGMARPNLFREIKRALPAYDAYFAPCERGSLIDAGEKSHDDIYFGIATFVRGSKLPVIESQTSFVHGSFVSKWSTRQTLAPRSAHAVRMYDRDQDREITVAHMHGLWDVRGKMDTPERRSQVGYFVELIQTMSVPSDEPVVVCGDFNVLPDSQTLKELKNQGLTELVISRGHATTRTSLYTKTDVPWADYLLVSPQVSVEGFDVPESPEVSDHRPLVLDMA